MGRAQIRFSHIRSPAGGASRCGRRCIEGVAKFVKLCTALHFKMELFRRDLHLSLSQKWGGGGGGGQL